MRRIVSIWLPRWPVDRLWTRPVRMAREKSSRFAKSADGVSPFVLVQTGAGGVRLYAVSRRAAEEGLATGMMLADARALVPALKTGTANPGADHKALLRLARWCGRYTPWVSCGEASCGEAVDGGDSSITLDISGCAHLFGGEKKLLQDLTARLSRFGITHHLGCADTLGAAWAVARFDARQGSHQDRARDRGQDRGQDAFDVVTPGQTLERIANLPVAALRLEDDITALLSRLGLKTIAALAAIPRLALMRRFPSSGSGRRQSEAVLLRLDQALGKRDEPLSPLTPAPAFRTRMAFVEPLTELPGLAHALDRLLTDLAAVLEMEGMGARRLTLAAYRMDGSVSRVSIGTGRPSRHPEHLMFLFKERLEFIDLQYGIDLLMLSADRVEPLTAVQRSMVRGGDSGVLSEQSLGPLVDRLANRLGPANVGRSTPRESHVPERAERRVSALSEPFEVPGGVPGEVPERASGGRVGMSLNGDAARPFRLFQRPEPLEVVAEVPEGPPLSFRWRRMNIRVARAEGPERIAPEWWLASANGGGGGSCDSGGCCGGGVRDYYRIEDTAGRRFWVYRDGLYRDAGRDGPPRWYMHGLFA